MMNALSGRDRTPAAAIDQDRHERELVAVVGNLVRELHPQRAKFIDVSAGSRIERDLGIDSLARTELILRIERDFRIRLPVQAVGEAETVADLLRILEDAQPQGELSRPQVAQSPSLPPVPAADQAQTLLKVLDWHAVRHPDRLHLTVLEDDRMILGTLTYGELSDQAHQVAQGLVARDIAPGDRIALMLPTGLDFFIAFFGILYAGAIPVPIYPPMRLSQLEEHLHRQARILDNAGAILLITVPEGRRLAGLLRRQVLSLKAVASVADLTTATVAGELPSVTDANAVALIQYTSGSTGDPKGVVLTHANLLANIRAMGQVMEASSSDVFLSWLPLYHDMGLIGAWLGCLHFAAPLYVMSPLSFLVRPESWLWAMYRFRATLSASPNFGFELCLNKIDDSALDGLDLSSLRMVANGAEPVSVQTLSRFAERFGPFGFRSEAMAPVYGLAENSVGLAFPPPGRPPIIDRVNREALSRYNIAEPHLADHNALQFVACGQPLPGCEIRIVDDVGVEVGDRHEGRIEFRGGSATLGYFQNSEKTRKLFHDGWLDTGDRGYMAGGDVYVTGRIKDIIIRAGRHLYPQEIEAAIADIPGIRKGCVAVFGVIDRVSGTERVVVLAETRETDKTACAALQSRAYEVATTIAGTPPDEIVLAPPRTVPKTSSGKIRRSAAKEVYERGQIGVRQRALQWQILRLWLAGVSIRTRRIVNIAGELAYAGRWWSVIATALTFGWLAVMILPKRSWRWAALRHIAKIALPSAGISITKSGVERIPKRDAIAAFNHASYLDVLILASIIPGEPAFVAKKELAAQIFAGPFLRRLGTLFVERYDVTTRLDDAKAVAAAARQARILVFFPEGSFTRRAGLSAFYLGAFKVATETKLPIVPGILGGTRSMLRSGQWFPRRTQITIEIVDPVPPTGEDFESVLRLRDQVRQVILAHCGEPDLDELVKPAQA